MAVRGIFASHSGIVGDRQQDLAGRVLQTMPGGMAPLLALSSGMPSAPTHDTAYSWIEDSHISGNTTAVGNVNSGAASFVVADSNIWTPQTILMNEATGEYLLVTGITGNTIAVIRGIGGTSPDDITDGDTIQSIGTGFPEGGGKPQPVAQRGESITNYVQIFKNGWAITGTAQHVKYLTGSQMALNREQCLAYHAEDIERAFLWGRKDVRVIDNKQFRLTNGVLAQIRDYGGHVAVAGYESPADGTMSLFGLQSYFRQIFDVRVKGLPNERVGFCGSQVLELIQQMVIMDGTYNIQVNETAWGIQVSNLNFFNGKFSLVTHPLMVENNIWNQDLYVFHPGLIRKRVLRDSWSEEFSAQKQNNNGNDATEGYIGIEMGFELKGAETQGILSGIQTAVPSYINTVYTEENT